MRQPAPAERTLVEARGDPRHAKAAERLRRGEIDRAAFGRIGSVNVRPEGRATVILHDTKHEAGQLALPGDSRRGAFSRLIEPDDGFTIDAFSGDDATSGYAVAPTA